MGELENTIEKAVEIAQSGTREEQESFSDYVCSAIRWFSSQGQSEDCEFFEAVYKAYLDAKNEAGQEQSVKYLVEQSGKSKASIYNLAKKLGRLPKLEEIKAQSKGRPRKYY